MAKKLAKTETATPPETATPNGFAVARPAPLAIPRPRANLVVRADIDGTTEEGIAQLYNLVGGEAGKGREYLGRTIEVVGYIVHPASVEGEDGEVHDYARTVLLLADGTQIAVGSDVIPRRLELYEMMIRQAPWDPPAKMQITPLRSRKGREYFSITAVVEPIAE